MAETFDREQYELVEKARNGDAASFGELVRLHRSRMLGWASRVVRDRATAEDIVQDALVQTLRKIGRLEQPDKFLPWLRTLVRNQALMSLRSGWSRNETPDRFEEGDSPTWSSPAGWHEAVDDPQAEAIGRLVAEDLRMLLSRLSPRDRAIAESHLLGGLSVREVAAQRNMTDGAVYTAVSRTRKKLEEARYEDEIERYAAARRISGRPAARLCERARPYALSGAYDTMAAMMTMTAAAAGRRNVSLTDVMGATGHAFRIQVAPDLGVSGPYAYDWADSLRLGWRGLGYDASVFGGAERRLRRPDELVTAMDALLASLERGVPAVAWNVSNTEFGLIEGFDDGKRAWIVTDTSAAGKTLPYAKLGRLHDDAEWFAAVPTGRLSIDRAAHWIELFERTARHMRGDDHTGTRTPVSYAIAGTAAYRLWIDAFDRQAAADALGAAYNAAFTYEARKHAATYLLAMAADGFLADVCPAALPAVAHAQKLYAKVAALWGNVSGLFPLPFGADPSAPGPADRAARLLERACAAEAEAVGALQEAAWLLARRRTDGRNGFSYNHFQKNQKRL
ncbi:RNA polymerase sigma factor [Paenibacillus flagellatus]|nr:sigma-70 family RNA polymerase sigma factor [Paenibacillus flagellatus]